MAKKLTATQVKKLSSKPGTRVNVPTVQLSAKDQAVRAQNTRFKKEVAPGLSYGDVARQAAIDTKLKYGESERQLAAQQTQNAAQGVRDQGFYKTYVDAINGAKAKATVDAQAAADSVANLGRGLDESSAKSWGAQAQAMSADAAKRGATVDPGLADVARNASNVRTGLTGSYGAQLLASGATNATGFGNRALVAQQQGIEQQGRRTTAGTDLSAKQTQLATDKGSFNVSQRSKLISDAADTALKNASTQSLIGSRETTAKNQAATRESANHRWSASTNKYGVTNGAWASWGKSDAGKAKRAKAVKDYNAVTHPAKKPSSKSQWLAPASQNTAKTNVDDAVTIAKDLKAKGYTREEAAHLMLNGRTATTVTSSDGTTQTSVPSIKKVSKDYASTALDVAFSGHISKGNVGALHTRKIQVRKLGYKTGSK